MKIDYSKLLDIMLNIGEEMLVAGAEINRVEDTLTRIGYVYGAEKIDVFVINTSIMLTIKSKDVTLSRTRRILRALGANFERVEKYNALSRRCAQEPIQLEQLEEISKSIAEKKPVGWGTCVGGALAAGAFCLFFGGNLLSSAVAFVFGFLVCILNGYISKICPNKIMEVFLVALCTGLGISLVCSFIPVISADFIIIGVIMLLVPGKTITNAARDILLGDTISGIMKLIESLFIAGTLAIGFAIAISII